AGLGLDRELVGIRLHVEEVDLRREHRGDRLVVRAREHAEAADLHGRVGDGEADVEVATRLLEVGEVAEAVGVPAEGLVLGAGLVAEAVHDEAVALVLAEAGAGREAVDDGREARVAEEPGELRMLEGGEGDPAEVGRAVVALALDERDAVDLIDALLHELVGELEERLVELVRALAGHELLEADEAVDLEEVDLLGRELTLEVEIRDRDHAVGAEIAGRSGAVRELVEHGGLQIRIRMLVLIPGRRAPVKAPN